MLVVLFRHQMPVRWTVLYLPIDRLRMLIPPHRLSPRRRRNKTFKCKSSAFPHMAVGRPGYSARQVAAPAVTRSTLNMVIGAAPSSVGPERGSVYPRKMSSGVRVRFHITGQGHRPAPPAPIRRKASRVPTSASNSRLTGALQICNVHPDLPAGAPDDGSTKCRVVPRSGS
jgi:hypothetical protein